MFYIPRNIISFSLHTRIHIHTRTHARTHTHAHTHTHIYTGSHTSLHVHFHPPPPPPPRSTCLSTYSYPFSCIYGYRSRLHIWKMLFLSHIRFYLYTSHTRFLFLWRVSGLAGVLLPFGWFVYSPCMIFCVALLSYDLVSLFSCMLIDFLGYTEFRIYLNFSFSSVFSDPQV